MTSDYTSSGSPVGVGYDSKGNAKAFVELSAISVTNVSATEYWGLPAAGTALSGMSDVCVSDEGDRLPLEGESLVWSGVCWAPSAVGTGGGATSLTYFSGLEDVPLGPLYNTNELVYCPSPTTIGTQSVTAAITNAGYTIVTGISYAPTASLTNYATTASLTNYATTASLTNYATTATAVTLGGTQTITGAKTFNTSPIVENTGLAHTYATLGAASALSSIASPGANSLLCYGPGNTPETIASTDDMLTFLGTEGDLGSLTNVSDDAASRFEVLAYDGNQWGPSGMDFQFGNQTSEATEGTNGIIFTVSNAITSPLGTTGKGDVPTGFVFVSGTDASSTEIVPASVFGKNWVSGNPSLPGDSDNFIYLSGNSGEDIAANALNSDAKDFMEHGNAGAGQLDHGALGGLGDDDHPQYRLSSTLITNAAMATMGAATVKGSVGGGTPADLSMTQLQSISKVKLRTPFHSDGGAACQLGAHPSTEQFLKNLNINIQIADLSTYSQVRMFCRIYTNSGSSNSPRLIAKYKTSYSTTVGDYSDIGTSEVSTSLASYTLANSGWINLADPAKIDDCYITVTQIGGDSSATPRISSLFMEFR